MFPYLIAELQLTTLIAVIGSLILCGLFLWVLWVSFSPSKRSELNCPHCGTKNETNAIFCKTCGKKVSTLMQLHSPKK